MIITMQRFNGHPANRASNGTTNVYTSLLDKTSGPVVCLGNDHVVPKERYDVTVELFSVRLSVPRLYNMSPPVANLD
jgi:hypothetical protein